MTAQQRPTPRDWLVCSLLGVVVGAVALGIGGRLAMWGVAVLSGATPGFSAGGTATVVLLGALWGLAGAIGSLMLQFLLPRRPRVRGALFWAFLVVVSLRGLRPIDAERLLLFMPWVIAYGGVLQVVWCRAPWRSRTSSPTPSGVGAAPRRIFAAARDEHSCQE